MTQYEDFDFLVVGSGLAGLTFALRVAEHGSVCVLTKAQITDSNTNWAQGGIAAAVGEADDWQLHEEDTLAAGAGLCDAAAVRFLVQQAPAAIDWLRSLGARFDLSLGREGGHSRNRIVHHGDNTGWEVERVVSDSVRRHSAISVYENAFVTKLLTHGTRVAGLTAQVADRGLKAFRGRAVMLATGGAGMLYSRTTNPRIATADGIGLADSLGANVRDMEFMQFHPTVLYHQQLHGFLLTEAIRGAGGTLRNHVGRRFMYDYDAQLELAPRDIVARAIEQEMKKLQTWCVYLDSTHLDPDALREEFPTIWSKLRELGIEMEKVWIPVTPGQHYSCGGVVTDLHAQSSVAGLYASGEVACTGVHGANRLASNSLLEAMVFSTAGAAHAQQAPPAEIPELDLEQPGSVPESEAVRIRHALQKTMTDSAGVFRTTAGLQSALRTIASLRSQHDIAAISPFGAYSRETFNLLVAARYVVEGALSRKKNVGLHYNADLTPNTAEPEPTGATSAPTRAE